MATTPLKGRTRLRKRKTQSSTQAERFPRTKKLPTQSPLYWVEQKDRYLRQLLIRDLEATTGRRLVVYYGNRYENAQIDAKDVSYVAELFSDVGAQPVDLLLETIGGVTDATEAIVSFLQNITNDLRVIVADTAKSNGTLLALAAKCIVMGATSELGPIEPLVNGIPCTILEQPQIAQTNFPLHMYGKYALQQTRALAKTLLTTGMMRTEFATRVDETVEALSSRSTYFSHGSVINHVEAVRLGLSIDYLPPDSELWQRLWLLYCTSNMIAESPVTSSFSRGGHVVLQCQFPILLRLPVPEARHLA